MGKLATIHLHGFNTSDYRNTVGIIDSYMRGLGIVSSVLVYHADNFVEARRKNPDVARRLFDLISFYKENGFTVIVYAHSNGNTILRMCYDLYGSSPHIAVCIQPALPSTLHPSPGAIHTTVYWNPYDTVVKLGKILTWITKLISDKWAAKRNWGQMGATGYLGPSVNTENVNTVNIDPVRRASEHSGIFDEKVSGYWIPRIAEKSIFEAGQL